MKARTIKTALRKKIDDWLSTIEDEGLRELLGQNVVVTGGCIVSMLTQEKINDYDIYFRTKEAAMQAALYYVRKFEENPPMTFKNDPTRKVVLYVEDKEDHVRVVVKSAGIAAEAAQDDYQYFEAAPDEQGEEFVSRAVENVTEADELPIEAALDKTKDSRARYRPIFISGNAITLSQNLQIVLRFVGEPEEIHKYYDFVHCTCHWRSWDSELVLPAAALEAILTKELRYVGSRYPLCSIIRIRKFVRRGYTINAGQILKMCMQISKLDLEDITVLEDQLTGVDAAYFIQVINRLKAKQAEDGKEGEPIDSAYLVTIIDSLF